MSVIYKNGTYYGAGGGGGEGADTEIIADDFDPTESYAVGEYVVYEGTLYKCTTAHTGAWDASDFEDTQVMAEMPTPMPAADMSEVVSPKPSVMSRRFKYSTEEQIVGTWIDGKPVYQKTVDCGALPNATSKTVAHGISNLAYVVDAKGFSANDSGVNIPIPYVHTSSGAVTIASQIALSISDTAIGIATGSDRRTFTSTYVTILYTKTTD